MQFLTSEINSFRKGWKLSVSDKDSPAAWEATIKGYWYRSDKDSAWNFFGGEAYPSVEKLQEQFPSAEYVEGYARISVKYEPVKE